MAVFEVVCVGCGETFEAKSRRAKWHSPACRKQAQRHPDRMPEAEPSEPGSDVAGLYDAVRRDLEKAGRLNTVHGQLALELAKDVKVASSKPAVAQKLLDVLAKALEGTESPAAAAPAEPSEEEQIANELEERRRRRAEKISAATGRA